MTVTDLSAVGGHAGRATQAKSAPDGIFLDPDQTPAGTHAGVGVDLPAANSHLQRDPHRGLAVGGVVSPTEAIPGSTPTVGALRSGRSATTDHVDIDTHQRIVGGGVSSPGEPIEVPLPNLQAARPEDALLVIYADALDDMERTRTANANRVRALIQVKGMEGTPEQQRLEALVAALQTLEDQTVKELQKAVRSHPLGSWLKAQKGLGDKQAGRLLAAVGDPYIDMRTGRPRTVSQLWAYCGYHVLAGPAHAVAQGSGAGGDLSGSHPSQPPNDTQVAFAGVAARRQRGQKANWNAAAKMRAHLCAEACIKAGVRVIDKTVKDDDNYRVDNRKATSDYGQLYLDRRAHTLDRVHAAPCVRCGPSGKPAQPGTPWSGAHQQADALRVVAKRILRDLWRESKRLHDEAGS